MITLLHISPSKNRQGILNCGLVPGQHPSGYGNPPVHKAIYLYHHDNINVVYDLLNKWDEFDVWEVNVNETQLIPDEDSSCSDWTTSIEVFGTCAYPHTISVENIKHMCTITRPQKKDPKVPFGSGQIINR